MEKIPALNWAVAEVIDDLRKKGVFILNDDLICEETGKPPQAGSVIVIRSHGISRELRQRLLASGCRLVDATCPFVEKIHKIADEKSRSGCAVVIIGNPVAERPPRHRKQNHPHRIEV